MVRTARTGDQTHIAAPMIQVWLHTYAVDGLRDVISGYVLSQFTPEKVGQALSSPNHLYLIAEIDGHIVGLAVIDWDGTCPAAHVSMPELHENYVLHGATA